MWETSRTGPTAFSQENYYSHYNYQIRWTLPRNNNL